MAKKKRSSTAADTRRTAQSPVKLGAKAMTSFHVPFIDWLVDSKSWSRGEAERSARIVAGFVGEILTNDPGTRVDAPSAEEVAVVLAETRDTGKSLLIIGARASLVAWVSFLRDTDRWSGSPAELAAVEDALGMNLPTALEIAQPAAVDARLRSAFGARREESASGGTH